MAAFDDKPVGIDVEIIKPIDLEIARRCFTGDEQAFIVSHLQEQHNNAFYTIWTKKEAYVKWNGSGLSKPLNSFSVLNPHRNGIHYHRVFENDDAVSHICTRQTDPPRFTWLTLSEIVFR